MKAKFEKKSIQSPHAAALASALFRRRVKPSGKNYRRKPRGGASNEEES